MKKERELRAELRKKSTIELREIVRRAELAEEVNMAREILFERGKEVNMPKKEPLYPHVVKSKVTAEKPYRGWYYCDQTNLHSHGEVIQVSSRLENPPCPYCGGIMTYGKYW